jgi:Fe-S-cluster containining protein
MNQPALPERTRQFISELQAVWAEIDRQTTAFQQSGGLSCPANCGRCCARHTVEVSMPEMLPLAADLWQRGEAEEYIAFLENNPDEKVCVFYRPQPANRELGYCPVYQIRPSLCRLFGFAGRINKYGSRQLNACEVHKQIQPEKAVANDQMPLFEQFYHRISGLDAEFDWTPLPINQALLAALRQVGFWLSFSAG